MRRRASTRMWYHKNCGRAQAFKLLEQGVRHDELVTWLQTEGISPASFLRLVRKGRFGIWQWRVIESRDYLQITHPQRIEGSTL